MTAGEIVEQFDISEPSISHHLELLRRAGLVVSVKEGQYIYYSINTIVMDEMVKWLLQLNKKKKEYHRLLYYSRFTKWLL